MDIESIFPEFRIICVRYNILPNDSNHCGYLSKNCMKEIINIFKGEFDEKSVEVYGASLHFVKLVFKIPKSINFGEIFYELDGMLTGCVYSLSNDFHLRVSNVFLFD